MPAVHELQRDFEAEVLERSHQVPVLVDFWAEWCGPCRTLGPVLESLAARAEGRWELVKVDTEAHPQIASRFALRSIPAVKLFHRAEAIAEFVGALPEVQILAWLDENLPGPGDDFFGRARRALADGEIESARAHLEQTLAADPRHAAARLELARLQMGEDAAAARRTLGEVPEQSPEYATAQHLLHLLRVVEWAQGGETTIPGADQADPAAVDRYRRGARAFARGEVEEALESWVEVVAEDRGLDDDGARRSCIAVFALLGEDHELTRDWRRRFSMALS